jgi:hypothetical protein
VLAILVNVFYPRLDSANLGNPAANIQLAADTQYWEWLHVALVATLLIILAAFYAVAKAIVDPSAAAWARFGLGAVVIGTTLGIAGFGILATLGGIGESSAEAVVNVGGGLLNVWVMAYFGLGALLYGLAIADSDRYPSWLGWVLMLGGLVGIVSGAVDMVIGPNTAVTYILFPVSSGILTLALIYLGVLLLRPPSRVVGAHSM